MLTAVILALAVGWALSIRAVYRERSKEKIAELAMQSQIAMSAEETKRMAIMAQAIQGIQKTPAALPKAPSTCPPMPQAFRDEYHQAQKEQLASRDAAAGCRNATQVDANALNGQMKDVAKIVRDAGAP